MIPIAYRTTGLLIKTLSYLSKARIQIHGKENIPPNGAIIFVINHFTRTETFLMPYFIYRLTQVPVWSLADHNLFKGASGSSKRVVFLNKSDLLEGIKQPRDLAQIILNEESGQIDRVVIGSLLKNEYDIIHRG